MKYIKLFATVDAMNDAKSSLETPWVALAATEKVVAYGPVVVTSDESND